MEKFGLDRLKRGKLHMDKGKMNEGLASLQKIAKVTTKHTLKAGSKLHHWAEQQQSQFPASNQSYNQQQVPQTYQNFPQNQQQQQTFLPPNTQQQQQQNTPQQQQQQQQQQQYQNQLYLQNQYNQQAQANYIMQSQAMPMAYMAPPPPMIIQEPVIDPIDPGLPILDDLPPSYSDASFLPATPSSVAPSFDNSSFFPATPSDTSELGLDDNSVDFSGQDSDGLELDMSGDEADQAIDLAQSEQGDEIEEAQDSVSISGLAVDSGPDSAVEDDAEDSVDDDDDDDDSF